MRAIWKMHLYPKVCLLFVYLYPCSSGVEVVVQNQTSPRIPQRTCFMCHPLTSPILQQFILFYSAEAHRNFLIVASFVYVCMNDETTVLPFGRLLVVDWKLLSTFK